MSDKPDYNAFYDAFDTFLDQPLKAQLKLLEELKE